MPCFERWHQLVQRVRQQMAPFPNRNLPNSVPIELFTVIVPLFTERPKSPQSKALHILFLTMETPPWWILLQCMSHFRERWSMIDGWSRWNVRIKSNKPYIWEAFPNMSLQTFREYRSRRSCAHKVWLLACCFVQARGLMQQYSVNGNHCKLSSVFSWMNYLSTFSNEFLPQNILAFRVSDSFSLTVLPQTFF